MGDLPLPCDLVSEIEVVSDGRGAAAMARMMDAVGGCTTVRSNFSVRCTSDTLDENVKVADAVEFRVVGTIGSAKSRSDWIESAGWGR